MSYKIIEFDPSLKHFEGDINLRMDLYKKKKKELVKRGTTLSDFANAHEYYGIHHVEGGWVYREWAPSAYQLYLEGEFNNWNQTSHPMKKLPGGNWELYLEGDNALWEGCKVKTVVDYNFTRTEHIPLYARRVVQDKATTAFCAEVVDSRTRFDWTDENFRPEKTPFIYECHIGMAQEEGKVGSYREFADYTLPRIKKAGYNTIQIMAIMEHPYYGSFGYQVSNFFAPSSWFGQPRDLKYLVNKAHEMGITVLLDVVHSHAVKNTAEGINMFDGTVWQFFHDGPKGDHPAWGTKCFDYGKNEVIHFLLSNLKYWMQEFHFDGFRFDGVTSMLYHDHGLGVNFDGNHKYFSMNTHVEAVTYLQLANELIHQLNPHAITVAEDMSGMPGMCLPIRHGGVGFDYRLSMGMPDFWIRTLKERRDEDWELGKLWAELCIRRAKEKNVGYCESHDQALVGDKTLMFRLCDAEMYTGMSKKGHESATIARGMALHKMIRLITASVAGEGYLNFMGNEFGHPEWIDFPREGNGWSFHYCRRQWSLTDNPELRYEGLNEFDRAMVDLLKTERTLTKGPNLLWIHEDDKVIVYEKGGLVFAFNFHPYKSFDGYLLPMPKAGQYKTVLCSDDAVFGGHSRVDTHYVYTSEQQPDGRTGFKCYLPSRSAMVFKRK
ncbi:MAG: alpha amylase C-terminal domain-containing protein [Oscillospiraceae bacterium]|nr:alpha amylase C-terminal domain-containing protein [Oscillospiraceae bacterium]MBR2889903.1 alpha amylase C-terminal domain-containing protein [Oscillospiraceae bacterium]